MDLNVLITRPVVSCQLVAMAVALYLMLSVVQTMNIAAQMDTTVIDILVHVMHLPKQYQQ